MSNTKLIKLNYRHSLKTMCEQLARHNETVVCSYDKDDCLFYELREANERTGELTQTCGMYYRATDIVEYINKRNGLV